MIIDISHNNGIIDWTRVKQNPVTIEGVMIKATQGVGYVDPMCSINSNGAQQNGFKIGYYHFASLNTTEFTLDATSEANCFSATLGKLPTATLPIALDFETDEANLTPNQCLLWIKAFMDQMKANGFTNLMIYSGYYFLNDHLPNGHGLGIYPLWDAAYIGDKIPPIPHGWNKLTWHQFTDKGIVTGIKGFVDISKIV